MSKIIIAGTDEVGRGSLAGPVVAAAVILKSKIANLQDSKSLSPKKENVYQKKFLKVHIMGLELSQILKLTKLIFLMLLYWQ